MSSSRPRVCLLTAGVEEISGGHRYHRQLLAAAPTAGFEMSVVRPRARSRVPEFDAVVLDSLYAWTLAAAARRRRRPPIVAIAHQHPGGVDVGRARRAALRPVEASVYRACELVVAPGPSVAESLVAEHGVDASRVRLIEPGCDLPPPATLLPPLRGDGRLGALNVANWLPNKGIVQLVDAMAAVGDDVTLHLAGRTDVAPDYTGEVLGRVARLGLEHRVVAHGPLPPADIAALHAAADVFVFPSRVETYGSAAAEAMAAGLPVIGWRTPHLSRLVTDDVEGVLVEPDRTDELTAALRRLADQPTTRQRLADGARRRGARLPTWAATTRRFFESLSGLLAKAVEPA